jgi:hypothetical protein
MSTKLNKSDKPKKVSKKQKDDNTACVDNNIAIAEVNDLDSKGSCDGFSALGIDKSSLRELNLKTKDCCEHYYCSSNKCIYSKNMKTNKWSKPKKLLQNKLLDMMNYIDSDDSSESDEDNKPAKVIRQRKQKKTKDEVYKEDQERLFNRLKKVLDAECGYFFSKTVNDQFDVIMGEVFDDAKKYYEYKHFRRIKNVDDGERDIRIAIAFIQKIYKFNNRDIIGKKYNNSRECGYIYYDVPTAVGN